MQTSAEALRGMKYDKLTLTVTSDNRTAVIYTSGSASRRSSPSLPESGHDSGYFLARERRTLVLSIACRKSIFALVW